MQVHCYNLNIQDVTSVEVRLMVGVKERQNDTIERIWPIGLLPSTKEKFD